MQKRLVTLLAILAAALAAVLVWLVSAPLIGPPDRAVMPETVGADLDAVGRQLVDAGYRVIVRRPAIVVPDSADAAGEPYRIPEDTRPFQPDEWTHLIAEQSPAPGMLIAPGDEIRLTAGVHHGAGPYRPWLETHSTAVRERGDDRCPACHAQRFCLDCHEAVGVSITGP